MTRACSKAHGSALLMLSSSRAISAAPHVLTLSRRLPVYFLVLAPSFTCAASCTSATPRTALASLPHQPSGRLPRCSRCPIMAGATSDDIGVRERVVAGAVAATVAAVIVNPFDIVKTRMQANALASVSTSPNLQLCSCYHRTLYECAGLRTGGSAWGVVDMCMEQHAATQSCQHVGAAPLPALCAGSWSKTHVF